MLNITMFKTALRHKMSTLNMSQQCSNSLMYLQKVWTTQKPGNSWRCWVYKANQTDESTHDLRGSVGVSPSTWTYTVLYICAESETSSSIILSCLRER